MNRPLKPFPPLTDLHRCLLINGLKIWRGEFGPIKISREGFSLWNADVDALLELLGVSESWARGTDKCQHGVGPKGHDGKTANSCYECELDKVRAALKDSGARGLETLDKLGHSYAEVARLKAQLEVAKRCDDCDKTLLELMNENDKMETAIEKVLADEESKPGGWGPDVTMVGVLRESLPTCSQCGGKGWYSGAEHDHGCDGSCANCPVEVQVQCDCQKTAKP